MGARLFILAALFLAGCSSPVITSAGPESVTIKYDPWLYTRDEMQAEAEKHCRQFGANGAAFVSTSRLTAFTHMNDVFACGD